MLSQTHIRVFAFNRSTAAPVLNDAINITAKWAKDYGAPTALTDVNPIEAEDGNYYFDLSEDERNVSIIGELFPESSTPGVQVIGKPEHFLASDEELEIKINQIYNSVYNSPNAPISIEGENLYLIQGDDYLNIDNRDLVFTSVQWVNLTGATVVFGVKNTNLLKQLSVVTVDDLQQLSLELTNIETSIPQGSYKYDVQATLSNLSVVTLFRGSLEIIRSYT